MEERIYKADVELEEYKRQIREEMMNGYGEMAEINLEMAKADYEAECQAEETTNDFLK